MGVPYDSDDSGIERVHKTRMSEQSKMTREERLYDRANKAAEKRNKRAKQANRRGEQLDKAKKAMSAAPYTNRVQEAKKKQRAKLKAKEKRSYYMGDG